MGSMSDSDRKRRHFSSLSPTPAAATAKKLPFLPVSEDKKLDIVVLQYQNQKLIQKLETQKLEYAALENRFTQQNDRQKSYDPTLSVVKKSWEQMVNDLELCSEQMRESRGNRFASIMKDGGPSTVQGVFLSRLMQTSATECATAYSYANQMEEHREIITEKTKNILKNMATAVNNLWVLMDGLHTELLKKVPVDDFCRQKLSSDLDVKVKNLRLEFSELHLKHKSLSSEFQIQRDIDAKYKADLERLKGELASAVAELEESNHKLAALKAERDAAKGAVLPVLNVGSTHIPSDKIRDKQKDLQDMESTLKDLLDQGSTRLMELKSLHEERIRILQQLCDLQNTLKNFKCITSSHAYQLARDQIEKSKSDVLEYQALYEKLQVEKDNLTWREREWYIKNDLADIFQRSVAVSDFRVADLHSEIQKKIEEGNMIENKLKEEAREPGRKQIIAEFKSLVSSFPEEMGSMQSQLRKYKESASDIHSLRADMQSVSNILDRKVKECDAFSVRSASQLAEIKRLLGVFQDLRESELDLKLTLEMFRRESIDSRDVMDAREAEYRAWAHVQSLKSSLDEHNLELRVKKANEAEARSQQKLAAGEAEIADMRQKLEDSKRKMCDLSDVLKSKNKQNENYLSEIESIGQAYDEFASSFFNMEIDRAIRECDDRRLQTKYKNATYVVQRALTLYSIEEVAFSFNGGKDSTVLLHILRAGYFLHKKGQNSVNGDLKDFPIRTIYFESPCAFPEINSFTYDTAATYGLQIDTISLDFKSGLEALLKEKPIRAIFLGVRIGDPTAVGQEQFSPSSPGWPPFMRVNPILDWSYRDVWAFLLTCKVNYCSLYDQGYTSIGSIHDTVPNSLLCVSNSSYKFKPAYLLADGRLERAGRAKRPSTGGQLPVDSNGLTSLDSHKNSMLTASIIVVGDEILFGIVEDQLGPYLCRKLHSIGWSVFKLSVVHNNIDSVAEEVERQKSKSDMVFIYGGVGPLHSDVTIAGIAKAFGVRLAPDEEFEEYLRHIMGDQCTGDRNEMAQLPEGITELWHHDKLSVPLIKCQNVIILSATNVSELEKQWDCWIELAKSSDLLALLEPYVSKHVATNLTDVEIAQPLSKLCLEFPDLYIGCYRKARYGSVIVSFKGKDLTRIDSAIKALHKKFQPGAFIEMN